jgi:hypothetical protein
LKNPEEGERHDRYEHRSELSRGIDDDIEEWALAAVDGNQQ